MKEVNHLGVWMQKARWDADKSQEYMALELDVARRTVQNWERGSSIPSLDKFKEWFKALGLNPMPYLYMYFYNEYDINESAADIEARELLINIIRDIPISSIKQFLYVINGNHGSSAKALLQLMIAHIQTPMRDRYHQAKSIYCNYELAKEMDELTDKNAVQPNEEFLNKAILNGRQAVVTRNDEYSML